MPREDSSGAGRQVSSEESCSSDMNPRNLHTNTMKIEVRAVTTAGRSLVFNPTLMQCAIHNLFSSSTTLILQLQAKYPSGHRQRIYKSSCHRASQLSRDVPADTGYSKNVPCPGTLYLSYNSCVTHTARRPWLGAF